MSTGSSGSGILAVDTNRRNLELLTQFFARAGFPTRTATSLAEFDAALDNAGEIAVALVDLSGFDPHIWQRCDRLRSMGIPFIVISPRQSEALRKTSLTRGARGMLVKPLSSKMLLQLVRSLVTK